MPKVDKQKPLKNLQKKKKCGLLKFFLQKQAPKSKYTIPKPKADRLTDRLSVRVPKYKSNNDGK